MALFAVRRRCCWADLMALETSFRKSSNLVERDMPGKVRLIRSYVIEEFDGRLGTVCVLEGDNLKLVAEHATKVGIRCDEISPIAVTMIARADTGSVYFRN